MGKREGEFVTLDTVIGEVGRDATRFFYLMRRHDTPLDFDLELAKRQSMDNPVYYVQYAHARCAAIRRRAGALEAPRPPLDAGARGGAGAARGARRSCAGCADFPDFVADAAAAREPHRVTTYLTDLAVRVPELLHAPPEGARRHASCRRSATGRATGARAGTGGRRRRGCTGSTPIAQVMRNGLTLLGVSAPGGRWGGRRARKPSRKKTTHERAIHCGGRHGGDGPPRLRRKPENRRWRDKIELRLDNRQVFFLFFGSAVVACMLFVLGVMVGKRIESRGQADAPELQDPLAALDRARQPPPGVAAPDPAAHLPEHAHRRAGEGRQVGARRSATPRPRSPRRGRSSPRPSRSRPSRGRPTARSAAPSRSPWPQAARGRLAVPRPSRRALAAAPKPLAAAPKPTSPAAAPKLVASARQAGGTGRRADRPRPRGSGKFTLQLSTFATADDASTFADQYPGAFVVASDVPGKGTAYRVRYGNFASTRRRPPPRTASRSSTT